MRNECIAKRLLPLFVALLLSSCTQNGLSSSGDSSPNDFAYLDDGGGRYVKKERMGQKINSDGSLSEYVKETYVFDKEEMVGQYRKIDNLNDAEYNDEFTCDGSNRIVRSLSYGKDRNDPTSEILYEYEKDNTEYSKRNVYVYVEGEKELRDYTERKFDEKGRTIEYYWSHAFDINQMNNTCRCIYEYDERDNIIHFTEIETHLGEEYRDYFKYSFTYDDEGRLSKKDTYISENDSEWVLGDEINYVYDDKNRLIEEKDVEYMWLNGEMVGTVIRHLMNTEYKDDGSKIITKEGTANIFGYYKTTTTYDQNNSIIDKVELNDFDGSNVLSRTSYVRDEDGNAIKEIYFDNLIRTGDYYSYKGDISELELRSYIDYEYKNDKIIHSKCYKISENIPHLSITEDYEYSPEGFVSKHVKNDEGKKEIEEYARTANFDFTYDFSGTDW